MNLTEDLNKMFKYLLRRLQIDEFNQFYVKWQKRQYFMRTSIK